MRHFLFHLSHAAWFWCCNFTRASLDYWGGWISWRTCWEATRHLKPGRIFRTPAQWLDYCDLRRRLR